MSEPIRILRVIARLNMGGPAIHVSNLAAGLETRGYHTTLVAGSLARGEDSMAFVAERLGVSVVNVPEMEREVAPLHDAQSIRRLREIMREERPHSSNASAIRRAARAAASCGERRLLIVHTSMVSPEGNSAGRTRSSRVEHPRSSTDMLVAWPEVRTSSWSRGSRAEKSR